MAFQRVPMMIAGIYIGVVAVATVIAVTVIQKKIQRLAGDLETNDRAELEALRARHAELKALVAQADQQEQRSMQIYGIAKSWAESVSWKEMAPRLSQGIQKIFSAYEFLLYAFDAQSGWSQLDRRGNWAKEPPIADLDKTALGVLSPPQIQESVPVHVLPVYSEAGGAKKRSGVLFFKLDRSNTGNPMGAAEEFGAQLGVALSKVLLFNRMEMQSKQDGLTGTLRRQPFMDRLTEEFKRAAVFHTPFSMMMVDIDHFKAVNDGHGHAGGDAVLARVGQILKESFYETDVVGRYGGEEFIILLPRAQADGVHRKAEALRKRIEGEVIASGFDHLRITISIGIAHFPTHGRDAETLIGSADRALYRAKETGRNRVIAA